MCMADKIADQITFGNFLLLVARIQPPTKLVVAQFRIFQAIDRAFPSTKYVPKKKPSPSTIRRNARRREMFLSKKRNPAPSSPARPLQYPPEVPTPEKERLPDAMADIHLTPVHDKGRVEVASQPSPPSSPSEPEGASSPSGQSSEESHMSSPPPTVSLKCDRDFYEDPRCRKTFNCEEDFRNHNHGVRNVCIMRSRHGAAFSRSFRKDCICD